MYVVSYFVFVFFSECAGLPTSQIGFYILSVKIFFRNVSLKQNWIHPPMVRSDPPYIFVDFSSFASPTKKRDLPSYKTRTLPPQPLRATQTTVGPRRTTQDHHNLGPIWTHYPEARYRGVTLAFAHTWYLLTAYNLAAGWWNWFLIETRTLGDDRADMRRWYALIWISLSLAHRTVDRDKGVGKTPIITLITYAEIRNFNETLAGPPRQELERIFIPSGVETALLLDHHHHHVFVNDQQQSTTNGGEMGHR